MHYIMITVMTDGVSVQINDKEVVQQNTNDTNRLIERKLMVKFLGRYRQLTFNVT